MSVDNQKLNRLVDAVQESPSLLAYLDTHFGRVASHLPDLLLTEAEESPYPLCEWLEALHQFDKWLKAHGLILPIENQIGYIACAAQAGAAYANLTQLPAQLAEMLENYGCDEAVECSSSP